VEVSSRSVLEEATDNSCGVHTLAASTTLELSEPTDFPSSPDKDPQPLLVTASSLHLLMVKPIASYNYLSMLDVRQVIPAINCLNV